MSVQMHFSTFMKYFSLTTGEKHRELAKYLEDGGWDYWGPARKAVHEYSTDAFDLEEAKQHVSTTAPVKNEKNNQELLARCVTWRDKQKGVGREPHKGVWQSPNEVFSVHMEPEFHIETNKGDLIVAVYSKRDKPLNRDQAGAGVIWLQDNYPAPESTTFGVFDAFAGDRGKLYKKPTMVSQQVLSSEIQFIEDEMKKLGLG